MIELWALLAIGGAFLQNLRSLLQRQLTARLTVQGASYVRFVYALPFAWLYWMALGDGVPTVVSRAFMGYVLLGAGAQILGTYALVAAVSRGNFAIGTAYSKTESAQAALFGLLLVGDALTAPLLAAIAVSFAGVVLLSSSAQLEPGQSRVWDRWLDRRVLPLGLLAAAGFALSAVCFRGAALDLGSTSAVLPVAAAAFTLAVVLSLQTLLQGAYLLWAERGQLSAVAGEWRSGVLVGLAGMLASVCWFTAMALHWAAAVRAVGQVEMLFTALTSVYFLRERLSARALLGMVLIVSGIVLLLRSGH
ncbi:MAG: EamA family transporter [Pseudomonadales bacterium]